MSLLDIQDLHVAVEDAEILHGLSLQVQPGEVHAIMGPNGSGKSTLAKVLAGRQEYRITDGSIRLDGVDLTEMAADERALAGVFMAFQYPVEVPGVNNAYFLRAALNALRRHRGEPELDAFDFLELIKDKMAQLKMDSRFLERAVNADFSGGEKKRNEILQMAVLQPKLCVLDETDSGLDIDALRIVADGVNAMRQADRGMILVTHYQRLLDYITPDVVHVLAHGRIVKSGGPDLAQELEQKGYGWIEAVAKNAGAKQRQQQQQQARSAS